jgi:hypothetical protein
MFRQHQRVMLAACAILAMIAFVFLGPLMDYFGGRGGQAGANPVVVSWNHGDLRESQMQYMLGLSAATNQFLEMAYLTAEASGVTPERPLILNTTEQAVVQTNVLAKAAENQGMSMSDTLVNDYLRRITGNSVNAEQFDEILSRLSIGNRRPTMQNIFDELRRRLLSQQMVRLYESWSYGVPPGERWSYFLKLNQQALVDVVPISTESFLSQVADPTDEQVTALYDRFKNTVARPVLVSGTVLQAPTPGFREPRRAQFQFFRANFNEFVEAAKPQITEAEIEKFYNENKAMFPKGASFLDDPEATPAEPAADGKTEAADPFAPGASPEAPAEPKTEATPGETPAAPAAETPATEPAAEAPKADAVPPADAKAPEAEPKTEGAPPAAETPAPSDPDQSSNTPGRARPGLISSLTSVAVVALQAEPPQADKAAAPAEPANSETPAATEKADETPAATQAPAVSPASGEPAAIPAASATPASTTPPPLLADPSAPAEPVEAESLDKVRDVIRKRLAEERAMQEIHRIFNQLEERMNSYASSYLLWQSDLEQKKLSVEEAKKFPPPPLPDFTALGKEFGVQAVTLPAMSIVELDRDTDLGKSFEMRLVQGFPMPGKSLLNLAFAPEFPVFRAVRTQDDEQNQFLSWKTSNIADFTPPLDKIRDQVVRSWKLMEAREPARKKAEQLAERARAATDKTLRQSMTGEPGVEVIEPDPFTWLTQGSATFDGSQQPPRLTPIPKLNNAGPEFMRKVFAMKEGDIGVAWNFPQNVMYVVQLKKFEESESVLHARFMSYNFDRYASAGMELSERVQQGWLGTLQNQQGLRWLRQPHQPSAR